MRNSSVQFQQIQLHLKDDHFIIIFSWKLDDKPEALDPEVGGSRRFHDVAVLDSDFASPHPFPVDHIMHVPFRLKSLLYKFNDKYVK